MQKGTTQEKSHEAQTHERDTLKPEKPGTLEHSIEP